MFVRSYKITEPKRFEIFIEDISNHNVLVKPDYLAICKADIRYYLGNRDRNILKRKFPMSLIHEATGVVLKDRNDKFKAGQRVVLLPCSKADCDEKKCDFCVRSSDLFLDNYCPRSKFRSSNDDGFSKEMLDMHEDYLVPIPDSIGREAVFSELISVACAAIRRADLWKQKTSSVTVWGDGIMGYIIALVAHYGLGCKVNVVGLDEKKLGMFDFANVYNSNDIENMPNTTVAFEAVGGNASAIAANQAIDKLFAGGKLILCGVASENAPLNTRMILEHGLTLMGTTRSTRCDFEKAIELLENKDFNEKIKALDMGMDVVDNIEKYYASFEEASKSVALGKRIMKMVF